MFVELFENFSSTHLFGGVNNIAAGNLSLVHQSVDILELAQANGLVRDVDQAPSEEVERLGRVSAVADVAALDVDHADDGVKDGGREVGIGGQADADQDALGAQILRGLLEGLLLDGDEQSAVGALAVGRGRLYVGDDVL